MKQATPAGRSLVDRWIEIFGGCLGRRASDWLKVPLSVGLDVVVVVVVLLLLLSFSPLFSFLHYPLCLTTCFWL